MFLEKETKQGQVIYLALEEKRDEVKKHFRDMGADGTEEIYIHAASAPVDGLIQLKTIAEEKKPALIIIDPLFRMTRIKDSNDYAQVTQALEPLLILARETGAHVMCVHHLGKGDRQGGDSILGSTAIFASVDTAILMKRNDKQRTIHTIQRYGEDMEERVLHFDQDTRTITLGQSKIGEDIERIKKAIVDFLSTQTDLLTEPDILSEIEGTNALKKKALRALVPDVIDRGGTGKRNDPYKYNLKDSSTLVRTIYNVPENQKSKNGANPHQQRLISGTDNFAGSDNPVPETRTSILEINTDFEVLT
jgi:hypothetical protein